MATSSWREGEREASGIGVPELFLLCERVESCVSDGPAPLAPWQGSSPAYGAGGHAPQAVQQAGLADGLTNVSGLFFLDDKP
jgi:hypothetical protein